MKSHYTNNSHEKTIIQIIRVKDHHTNITRINIVVVINHTHKQKAKTYNHCTYAPIIIKNFIVIKRNFCNYIKKFSPSHKYKKKFFC